jgi:hypothetical protein
MAFPTAVNSQITDSVTHDNTKVVGDAPAVATANVMVVTSQALSNAAHNATNNQSQSYVTMQATTTQGVATLLAIDPASTAVSTSEVLGALDQVTTSASTGGVHSVLQVKARKGKKGTKGAAVVSTPSNGQVRGLY